MAKQRYVYRDYRKGKRGEFTDEATFNRSQGQGVVCHVHREKVNVGTGATIDDLFDYEDYPDDELEIQEIHGTGDTGRSKKG